MKVELKTGDHADVPSRFSIPPTTPKAETATAGRAGRVVRAAARQRSCPKRQERLLAVKPGQSKDARTPRGRHALRLASAIAGRRPRRKSIGWSSWYEKAESAATLGSGIQLAMQAVLCLPKFLFRVELDDRPDSAEPHPID